MSQRHLVFVPRNKIKRCDFETTNKTLQTESLVNIKLSGNIAQQTSIYYLNGMLIWIVLLPSVQLSGLLPLSFFLKYFNLFQLTRSSKPHKLWLMAPIKCGHRFECTLLRYILKLTVLGFDLCCYLFSLEG